jgi:hypothetical protein
MTKKLLEILFTIIAYLAFAVWDLLSIIVALFLLDRWLNPHTKGISNVDLKGYMYAFFVLLPIFGAWIAFKVKVKRSQKLVS